MKRLLAIAAFAAISALTVTFGAGTTANVSWTMPVAYFDGTALPASDIAFTTLTWSPQAGAGPSGSLKVTAPATTAVVPVPCGSVNFVASVTTTSGAVYPGSTSDNTGPVPYATGVSCKPNPITGLAVH